MNKKIIVLVFMLAILTVSNVKANNWIIEGNTVCTDNETWGELCTNPHTLHGPGYAYCNATMAENYGNIDFVWGFNTSLERPRSIDLYNPHWDNTSSTQFFQNVSNIVICDDICEIGHEYNDIKRNVTYDRCLVWNETTMECEEYEQVTQTVCFDSYEQDGNNYTVTWYNARMKYWTDKTHLIESVNYNWNGMNKWYYIKDISMPADVTKTVRIWIDIPAVLGAGEDTKFFFAAKRTTDTIQEAIAADRFMILDPWHNASRSHRKTVNVTHVNATGSNLVNYTVFLNISKETEMQTDFDDILFYETDGTAMSFEYENHTASYGLFWVLVPSLTAASDTQFWMYYGNDAAISSSNPESSWNVNCSMVQHLQEAPANDTAGHLDSTSNDNDGTPKNFDGTPTSTTDGTGIVDGADVFDGTDDYIDCGSGSNLDNAIFTIEAWIKFNDFDANHIDNVYYACGTEANTMYFSFYKRADHASAEFDNTFGLNWDNGTASSSYVLCDIKSIWDNNEWHHVVGIVNGYDSKLYLDGIEPSYEIYTINSFPTLDTAHTVSRSTNSFNGSIDQVRIYNRARSANEINQSYQLVENQTTFVTWGSAEQQSEDTILHIENAINMKEDWGRDFNSNFSANVTTANASGVWMNFSNAEFTNTSLGWVNLTLNEWVNESHNVNAPVTNVSVTVTLNSPTSGATNDTDSFYYEITNRTNTATMDSAATQNVDVSETFYVNATCNEEYGDTFLGGANLLDDGTIIDTDSSVTNYVNFSHSESSAGQYNYTVRFYNLTYYDNVTTPTYSNVTVSSGGTIPSVSNVMNGSVNFTAQWINWTVNQSCSNRIKYWYTEEDADEVSCSGTWNVSYPCANTYDGNWSSYGTTPTTGYVYFNYSIPLNASRTLTKWYGKDQHIVGPDNMGYPYTIPLLCWNSPLCLRVEAYEGGIGQDYVSWQCHNGTDWEEIEKNQSYFHQVYEERMEWVQWSIWQNGTDAPNITLANLSECIKYHFQVFSYNTTNDSLYDNSSTYDFTKGNCRPPIPVNLQNNTGNFWINHTYIMGTPGNVTDSYNVSIGAVWHNTTTVTYHNDTGLSAHDWSNVTVWAYNMSGNGSLSTGNISDDVRIPNNVPVLSGLPDNTTDEDVNQTDIFDLDDYYTDADSDNPTYLVESNNQSANVSVTINVSNNVSYTLASGWNGTAEVVINVTDGWGGEDNDMFLIFVDAPPPGDYIPPDPTNLQNTTGNGWVNYTWDAGTPGNITNSYNVSWNSTWYNTTLVTYMNDTVGAFEWANITVWSFNSSGNGSLSAGNVTDDTRASGGTFVTNMNTGVWNLISYYNSTNGTAEEFGIDIGSVDYVAMYNGSFYTHTMGMTINNFTTVHGVSYFIFLNVSGSSTYTRNNIADSSYNTSIYNRWNTIGWTNATSTDASSLTEAIGTDCNFVCKLNADGISHISYTRGFITNKFAIDRGYGYWAWNANDTIWNRNS